MRLSDSSKRLGEMRSSGVQTQSAEQLLSKLQRDVRDLSDKKEALENGVSEREAHLSKLQGWEKSDRITTEDDVRAKRDQVGQDVHPYKPNIPPTFTNIYDIYIHEFYGRFKTWKNKLPSSKRDSMQL